MACRRKLISISGEAFSPSPSPSSSLPPAASSSSDSYVSLAADKVDLLVRVGRAVLEVPAREAVQDSTIAPFRVRPTATMVSSRPTCHYLDCRPDHPQPTSQHRHRSLTSQVSASWVSYHPSCTICRCWSRRTPRCSPGRPAGRRRPPSLAHVITGAVSQHCERGCDIM